MRMLTNLRLADMRLTTAQQRYPPAKICRPVYRALCRQVNLPACYIIPFRLGVRVKMR
jgi:hypothetical protein